MKKLLERLAGPVRAGAIALALGGFALAAGTIATAGPAQAENIVRLAGSGARSIEAPIAKPTTFRTDVPFNEIVVGDPEVAVVTALTDQSFYIVGLREGSTGVVLYNEQRELVASLDLNIGPDTEKLNAALQKSLKGSDIRAENANGRVVISGKAKDSKAAEKARKLAEKFDKDAIDSVNVEGSTQVQLEVRFVEAQRSKTKEFGVGLGVNKDNGRFGYGSPPGYGFTPGPSGPGVLNTLVSGALPFGQFLGNLISHGVEVDVLLQALETKGVARRLAEPNLVALSGDTASFLAGGEFPIPVSGDSGSVSVSFKKFGVGLEFTPTVLENGLINMKIAPEVSAIDPTASVNFNGLEIPGLVVRRASTTVELRDGQSFVMAGLLQSTGSYDVRKFPWLGDLPILGPLFRSAAYRKQQTDLVIIVTPRLVKPLAPGTQIATPLDSHAAPNDVDLFAKGRTEVSRARLRTVAEARDGVIAAGHILDF